MDYNKRSPRYHAIPPSHPDFEFEIQCFPQYLNEQGHIACHPGSVFEGIVHIKVLNSTPVHHIKLVFKASGIHT